MAAQGVDAGSVTTNARAAGTFINVDTLILVGGQSEARPAAALEAARDVGAVSVTADVQLATLVDVPAVAARDVQAVAGGTLTVETARGVDTLSQAGARVEAGQGALVGVHTLKYRGGGRGLVRQLVATFSPPYLLRVLVVSVAWLALAPVAPQRVHTGPVLADALSSLPMLV